MTKQQGTEQGTKTQPVRARAIIRLLRWTAVSIVSALTGLVLLIVVLAVLGIPLNLSWLSERVEVLASESLGREVVIEGPLTLVPGLRPSLQVEQLRIGNPPGWLDTDLGLLQLARVRTGIVALLRGNLRIDELVAEGLTLNLATSADGAPNWLHDFGGDSPGDESAPESGALRFVELKKLLLSDVVLTYRDGITGETLRVELAEVTGDALNGRPVHLSVGGTVQELPYELRLTGGTLGALTTGETPWPLDVQVKALGMNLGITGTVSGPIRQQGVSLDFAFEAETFKDLETVLGKTLPALHPVDLRGHIEGGKLRYEVTNLDGKLGMNRLNGDLATDFSGARPGFRGRIDVPVFDAGIFVRAIESEEQKTGEKTFPSGKDQEWSTDDKSSDPRVDPDQAWDLDAPILAIETPKWVDADFTLTVSEVINSPISLQDASLGVSIADGRLNAPLALTLADVPFRGVLTIASDGDAPKIGVELGATDSQIGELARLFIDAGGIDGRFHSARLDLSAEGDTLRNLVGTSELDFSLIDATLSYGHDTEGRPVDFSLNSLEMAYVGGKGSTVTADGALLGEPFSMTFKGGTFKDKFVSGKWPVELEANGGGANLKLKGVVAPIIEGLRLEYSLAGKRLGGLASWIPVSPKARESFQLSGEVYAQGADTRIRVEPGRIGGMRFTGEAGIRQENGKPVSLLTIDAGVVDPREIKALLPKGNGPASSPDARRRYAIDVPVLPRGIEIFDSDINLAIERLETRPIAFTDVAISARFRDGFVGNAPIRAVVAGKTLEGSYGVDLRGDIPAIDLDVRSQQVDLGALLERVELFDGLEMTAGQFRLVLRLAGRSAREMMERSEFSATLREGLWRVRDANTGGVLAIGIDEGTITASRDDPMALTLDGKLDKVPLRMVLTTDSLASFGRPKERLSLDAGIEFPYLRLDLEGIAPLPVRRDNLSLGISVVGRRLSDANDFLDISLPPWGPYTMSGTFGSRPSGYYLEALEVAIGSSTLDGKLELLTSRKPPRLVVDLEAGSIQLDDFDTGVWSPLTGGGEEESNRGTDNGPAGSGNKGKDRAMLSPQVMRMLEGQVNIRVKEVLSGLDRLGNGNLEATLENGRFSVDPLMLAVPGGRVDLAFSLKPTAVDIALDAKAKIDRFDYGYLARRIDPDSRAAGLISVDVDLKTRGPRLADVMEGAYGGIDLAVWPKDMNAGIFDLWATNLLIEVLPSLDTGDGSKVNCVVALFGIEDGIMRPDSLFIDSTRVQATADGVIDFKNRTINFLATPQPKRPHLFSAQTPIQVEGKFSDFTYGVSPGSLLGTTIRMVTSPVVVPLQWMFVERAPADGEAACGAAWGNAGNVGAETGGN